MTPTELSAHLETHIPGASVNVKDLTGTQNHYEVSIVSTRFEGTSRLQRHRLVYALLKEQMVSEIHALSVQAHTPAESTQ